MAETQVPQALQPGQQVVTIEQLYQQKGEITTQLEICQSRLQLINQQLQQIFNQQAQEIIKNQTK